METKLTLRLDEHAIEQAKAHAAQRGTSVSKLVEAFFTQLSAAPNVKAKNDVDRIPKSSVTHRLHGLLEASDSKKAPNDINGRAEQRAHLEKKHR